MVKKMRKFETKSFDLDVNVKSAVPIYEQIKNAVKISIFTEKLRDGDQIVSIRELSTRYNINPITIMKAYNQLESEGYLFSRRGAGYYVKTDKRDCGKGKREILEMEVSRFLKKIAALGFNAKDLLIELNKYMEGKTDD